MEKEMQCLVCQTNVPYYITHNSDSQHLQCPVCGKYESNVVDHIKPINKNQLSAYLAYHAILPGDGETRHYTTLDRKFCEKYNHECGNGELVHVHPLYIDANIVANNDLTLI